MDGAANTLGLDDDLDDVELVQSVESAFDVRIPSLDAGQMRTVGDLHDWLVRNVNAYSEGKKCATAMTFHRLRIAFRRLGVGSQLLPSTQLQFLEKRNLKRLFSEVKKETGLRLPSASPGKATLAGFYALVVLALAVVVSTAFLSRHGIPVPAALGLIALTGCWVLARDKGGLPARCATFGELAKTIANMNYGRLVKMGAMNTPDRAREALLDLLSVYGLPRSQIRRETVFLASELKNRAAA